MSAEGLHELHFEPVGGSTDSGPITFSLESGPFPAGMYRAGQSHHTSYLRGLRSWSLSDGFKSDGLSPDTKRAAKMLSSVVITLLLQYHTDVSNLT